VDGNVIHEQVFVVCFVFMKMEFLFESLVFQGGQQTSNRRAIFHHSGRSGCLFELGKKELIVKFTIHT